MRILNQLFNPVVDNYTRALGQTRDRQAMLTANLANVNTPGYKRKDLEFGITLDSAEGRSSRLSDWAKLGNVDGEPTLTLRADGNNVDLEQEIAGLAETELRYQTLTEMTSRYFSGLKNVIREGR